MKSEIKRYQKLICEAGVKTRIGDANAAAMKDLNSFIEMQEQKNEYEKHRGFSGEKRLFNIPEESDEFSKIDEI